MAPLGTANVLSYHLRGKKDLSVYSARERLFPVSIRLGEFGGRFFVLMAGIGFDGRAAEKTLPRIKKFFGSPAYLLAALSAFVAGLGKPASLSFSSGGGSPEIVRTYWAVLRRFPIYFPPFPTEAPSGIPDRAFRLDIFTGTNRRNLCRFLLGTMLGKTGESWYRTSLPVEEIRIQGPCSGQMDGETVRYSTGRFSVSDRRITLLFTEKGLRRSGILPGTKRGVSVPSGGPLSFV